MTRQKQAPVKYVTNKELLAEIAKCKQTYCHFISPEYAEYDDIVSHNVDITDQYINEVLERLNSKLLPDEAPRVREGLVFRVMSYDHIPIDPERKRKSRVTNENHARTNFPPFRHVVLRGDELVEVGRSHWVGDLETGHFSIDGGKMTDRLGRMFMKLVERYSMRANWRGYCVDETTDTLTKRGWVSGDDLKETDEILSYDSASGNLVWSTINSIYRNEYDGDMFRMTARGFDALVTPNHKWVTDRGIVPVDLLKEDDHLILMGNALDDVEEQITDENISTYIDEGGELSIEFILSLSTRQRELAYNISHVGSNDILSTLLGKSTMGNAKVSEIDLHGGMNNAKNIPTEYYKGRVWCPETQYGCFVARRNGCVYITGNSYRDEMCGLALCHLSQVGLQFDESKSSNPFAFFTTTIMHCFTRIANLEKKNQTIRDDMLINMGMAPSHTRQIDAEFQSTKLPAKRGRKSAIAIKAEAEDEKVRKESGIPDDIIE